MKKIILILTLLLLAGCAQKPIGGERDEHGCLGPAGYTWNKSVGACIREWELNDNQKQAAKIAVEYIGYEKGTTILEVLVARCPGCFLVHLEKGKDRIDVTLEDWEIKGKTLTPDECIAEGGRTVNIVGGDSCSEDETDIGKVTGFISPNICCVGSKITNFEECAAAGNPVMESYPRQCRADDETFVEEIETCKDLCGDKACQEIVCMAVGCPCAETKDSCPVDCE